MRYAGADPTAWQPHPQIAHQAIRAGDEKWHANVSGRCLQPQQLLLPHLQIGDLSLTCPVQQGSACAFMVAAWLADASLTMATHLGGNDKGEGPEKVGPSRQQRHRVLLHIVAGHILVQLLQCRVFKMIVEKHAMHAPLMQLRGG